MNALMPPPVPDVDPDWLAVRKTHLINELTRSGKDRRRYVLSAAATGKEPRSSRPKRRALIAVAAGAAAVGVAIGAAVASNGPSGAPGRGEVGQVHVRLADFSVDTNPGGTVTVALRLAQKILDPDALRGALAQAGVPARITVGSFCYNPVDNRDALDQAVAFQKSSGGEVDVVITPSKLPAGSTLAIAYAVPPLHTSADPPQFSLLTAGAPVTCSSSPPAVFKDLSGIH
jgi:hypothetical protein